MRNVFTPQELAESYKVYRYSADTRHKLLAVVLVMDSSSESMLEALLLEDGHKEHRVLIKREGIHTQERSCGLQDSGTQQMQQSHLLRMSQ
ncbi:hypothetical protein C0J52_27506 [Blattella germanica]|nr:hypothetical protein C0J52_27506 [Blattella germanica]